MAEDEDDDYMGDLARYMPTENLHLVKPQAAQVRKGKEGNKVKQPWIQKKKLKQEQKQKTETEQRQEGMNAAIPASNIGFKMLQQMGYQPGKALGKHGQGAIEPVNVDLKLNRTGLGRDRVVQEEKVLKSKFTALAQERKRKKVDELRVGFQERRRDTWHYRKIVSDYRKSSTALLQLEERSLDSVAEPARLTTERLQKPNSENKGVEEEKEGDVAEEEEEEIITDEMLQENLLRLRNVFRYCLYCGFQMPTPVFDTVWAPRAPKLDQSGSSIT